MKTVIKNISELVQVEYQIRKWVSGSEMSKIDTIKDGFIEIQDGVITAFGSMDQWTGIDDWNNTEIIDANGGMVFPSYCDSHTHLVFAGNRENEWEQRIKGASYEDIAKNGGGILNSAKKLQETSEEELLEKALDRAKEVMKMGTGAIEIKSGYGLTTEAELKMLRVIKRLKKLSPLTIKATFLGAHAIPKEYKTNKSAYLDLIIDEMLPQIAQEQLAEYIDIFCEEGYFSVEDTLRLLEAAQSYGLLPKTHVNQFTILGGVKASIKYKALSVDHLEIMNNEDIEALKGSQDSVNKMIKEFQERRDFLVTELNKIKNVSCVSPGGAFYVFPKINKKNQTSKEISNFLLEKKFVATVPGSSFGVNGEGFLRISYANKLENLKKFINLLSEYMNE